MQNWIQVTEGNLGMIFDRLKKVLVNKPNDSNRSVLFGKTFPVNSKRRALRLHRAGSVEGFDNTYDLEILFVPPGVCMQKVPQKRIAVAFAGANTFYLYPESKIIITPAMIFFCSASEFFPREITIWEIIRDNEE